MRPRADSIGFEIDTLAREILEGFIELFDLGHHLS
jgi:hypothetical protein